MEGRALPVLTAHACDTHVCVGPCESHAKKPRICASSQRRRASLIHPALRGTDYPGPSDPCQLEAESSVCGGEHVRATTRRRRGGRELKPPTDPRRRARHLRSARGCCTSATPSGVACGTPASRTPQMPPPDAVAFAAQIGRWWRARALRARARPPPETAVFSCCRARRHVVYASFDQRREHAQALFHCRDALCRDGLSACCWIFRAQIFDDAASISSTCRRKMEAVSMTRLGIAWSMAP